MKMIKSKLLVIAILFSLTGSLQSQTNALPLSGYVGIGTTAPSFRLEIPAVSTTNFDVAKIGGFQIARAANDFNNIILTGGHFNNSNTTIMPTSTEIAAYQQYSGQHYFSVGTGYTPGTPTSTILQALVIANTGRVGIGTSTPDAKLNIINPSTVSRFAAASFYEDRAISAGIGANISFGGRYSGTTFTEWAGIGGIKENGTEGNYAGSLGLYTRANGSSMAEIMRISSNGNVGIGTTNPGARLDVSGGSINVYNGSLGFGTIASSVPGNTGYLELVGGGGGTAAIDVYAANHATNSKVITFSNNSLERMRIGSNGNIGIGSSAPNYRLEIQGDGTLPTVNVSPLNTSNMRAIMGFGVNASRTAGWEMGQSKNANTDRDFYLYDLAANSARLYINTDGNLGIGTTTIPSGYKMAVNGNIRAKKLVIETNWSDYVFEDDYKLMPLFQVESFIKINKHLPDVPSAKEVEEKGISVGDNQALLLKKVEELTLYIIQQEKKISELSDKIARIKK
jgi:hypothetical protein